jgi:hypothetical protein
MDRQTTETWLLDLQGPLPWTDAQARRVVDAWEASGVSVSAFARRSGLQAKRVERWCKRLGVGGKPAKSVAHALEETSGPTFLPVTVRAASVPSAGAAVTVCTRDGIRVEVAELDATSAAWVAALVRSLAEASS